MFCFGFAGVVLFFACLFVLVLIFSPLKAYLSVFSLWGVFSGITDKGQTKSISVSRWTKDDVKGALLTCIKPDFFHQDIY